MQLSPEYVAAFDLLRYGYVVVPMLDVEETLQWRVDMLEAIHSFPEYKYTATTPVLGGFAALGNAASFHHPVIRAMRHTVYARVLPLLRHYGIIMGTEEDLRSELLFDRIMWRRTGQAPSTESWHRDVTVKPPKSYCTIHHNY
jgi:hypothetical protein